MTNEFPSRDGKNFYLNLIDLVSLWIFRPSEHNGFASHESYEREKYKAAEVIGEHGHDCDEIYSECESSFLDRFSYLDK